MTDTSVAVTPDRETKERKKTLKKEKKKKKEEKKSKKERKEKKRRSSSADETDQRSSKKRALSSDTAASGERPLVESSHLEAHPDQSGAVTLLLFYQYIEPAWSNEAYKDALSRVEQFGRDAQITGRMRVAKEGLNCTLTGSHDGILHFCRSLRHWKPDCFGPTEFKLTHHLPEGQRFPDLKVIPVSELVYYGIPTEQAPPIQQFHGTHLEPTDYHKKLAEENTVVIDVRNHYEATIGHFDPPQQDGQSNPPEWVNPKMRKSTEFPGWLDEPSTREKIKGKQVLMYCTGGIRCERASSLLKYKMETDPAVKDLNIQGVFQLQGGIDKYFKQYPDGGYWKGKNYTFDKRFAHAPAQKEAEGSQQQPMGQCEACHKPWDKYRGKRRCPACDVPSLICRDCWQADKDKTRKIDRSIRCNLCVEQGIMNKREYKAMEEERAKLVEESPSTVAQLVESGPTAMNPDGVTRLYLKNMCRRSMTEEALMEFLPGITHIVWRIDRKSNQFLGQGWVEMETPVLAAQAVSKSGQKVLGRPLYIAYQPADSKDAWPPPSSSVKKL